MPDFSIPLSGLTSESTALSAIANNLSNQNTTGYKDTSVLFSDLFYQSLGTTGSGDPIQVGAGVEIGAMPSLFTQGSISSTGVPTDVAIQGNGFFAVQNADGTTDYTRAGDFTVNSSNYLVTSSGQQVLGYPAVNGVVNSGAGIAPLQLGAGTISPPTATANVDIASNLDASSGRGHDLLDAGNHLRLARRGSYPDLQLYQHRAEHLELQSQPSTGRPEPGWRRPRPLEFWPPAHLTFNGNGALIGTSGGVGTPTYGPATGGGANVGNGTIMAAEATGATVAQTVTLTATSATTFSVVGSVSGAMGTATVGSPFTSGQLGFTIAAGSTAFATGDTITVPTTPLSSRQCQGYSHYRLRRRRCQPDHQLECAQRNSPPTSPRSLLPARPLRLGRMAAAAVRCRISASVRMAPLPARLPTAKLRRWDNWRWRVSPT